jgi:hypothetical protein
MPASEPTSRENQRRRTRKDLLQAAARLMKEGRTPSLDEVAETALVSRATAYRYFPMSSRFGRGAVDVAVPEDRCSAPARRSSSLARVNRVDAAILT